jgi:hypothetical protein
MNDSQGRYATSEVKYLTSADGRVTAYLARRLLPDPAAMTLLAEVAFQSADRLDVFAARMLGEPRAWWRIADANRAMDPAELEVPGRRLAVPLPEAGS